MLMGKLMRRISSILIAFTVLLVVSCNTDPEELVPQGKITGAEPQTGSAERKITITSNNAFGEAGANIVKFNGVKATVLVRETDAEIDVWVPAGATTGKITVESNGVVMDGPVFTVTPIPETKYFFKYKKDGVSMNQEQSDNKADFAQSDCVCYQVPPLDQQNSFMIIAWTTDDGFDANNIKTLKGKSFPVGGPTDPYAIFYLYVDGKKYITNKGTENSTPVVVSDVVYRRSVEGWDVYDVSGTFTAVATENQFGVQKITLTEGTFTVPLKFEP